MEPIGVAILVKKGFETDVVKLINSINIETFEKLERNKSLIEFETKTNLQFENLNIVIVDFVNNTRVLFTFEKSKVKKTVEDYSGKNLPTEESFVELINPETLNINGKHVKKSPLDPEVKNFYRQILRTYLSCWSYIDSHK